MKNRLLIMGMIVLFTQSLLAFDFYLTDTSADTAKMYEGLSSNGVTSIALQGPYLVWLGTGGGLSKADIYGNNFISYYPGDKKLPYGSITAISTLDSLIWVAGVYDSTISDNSHSIGGGLAYSQDYGLTWEYVPQPVNDTTETWDIWGGDTIRYVPVTTIVNNTTWDIATTKDYTYIVSWAGGLRRTGDLGKTWQRVPLPADYKTSLGDEKIDYKIDPRDPAAGGNHNHKGFSVIAYSDTVWVGTANGINRGIVKDDYIQWEKFNAQNSAISGNFVVGLHRQVYKGQETIWAVTLPADNAGEYQAVSKSTDGGLNWTTVLEYERAYSISSYDSLVFVSTQKGLFKSIDGQNWSLYRAAEATNGDRILDETVYEAKVDDRTGEKQLWIGTSDGIGKRNLHTMDWEIYRSYISTQTKGQPTLYAYPNPFSPTHQNQLNGEGHVRFQYDLQQPGEVVLEIFSFAMERIYKSSQTISTTGDNVLLWNGRTDNGFYAANGTYFCKLTKKINGKSSTGWTKLMIIK